MGLGSQFCTLLEVWVLGVGMSTLGAQTSLYTEDRGIQVPMTLDHGNIVGTQCCDNTVPHLVRPDPRVRQRISDRCDPAYLSGPHWFFQVDIKTHSQQRNGGRNTYHGVGCPPLGGRTMNDYSRRISDFPTQVTGIMSTRERKQGLIFTRCSLSYFTSVITVIVTYPPYFFFFLFFY